MDYKDGKKYPDIEKPNNFSHSKWVAGEDIVYTYSIAMKNRQGLPLSYIIRKSPSPSCNIIDREQEILENSPLQGNMFSRDTNKVLAILK